MLFFPRPEVLARAHRFLAEDYEGEDADDAADAARGHHRQVRYACGCVCGCRCDDRPARPVEEGVEVGGGPADTVAGVADR